MNTNDWYITYRDLDTEAMLHVEGRQPKLIVQNWQWQDINLHPETDTTAKA